MTEPRRRHRGASYVASASDGIMNNNHKVYASSSDDDSPAGFLQSAYNSPPASPRCAPRRQVTYSVTESEEDVSESPDAFVVELTRSDNFWTQRVRWYPDDCFGPYRAERLGYSRRELCADALVHLVGIVAFCVEINQCVTCTDNSSLSHFSVMTRPCWLRRAVRNEDHHAIEQASRRWRAGRRVSTNVP